MLVYKLIFNLIMVNLAFSNMPVSILVLFTVIIFSTCEDVSDETLNNDLIFPAVHEIKVPSYVYQSMSGDILIQGDEGYNNNAVDTITPTPTIRWDSVQTKLIVTAIFIHPIQVTNGKIENTNDIIWIWYSGLEDGKDGWVTFEEGRSISDGMMDNLGQPIPLPALHQYFWGVWGWNESGIKVLYSSRQMTFYVK
jgi:hypothetical protein